MLHTIILRSYDTVVQDADVPSAIHFRYFVFSAYSYGHLIFYENILQDAGLIFFNDCKHLLVNFISSTASMLAMLTGHVLGEAKENSDFSAEF